MAVSAGAKKKVKIEPSGGERFLYFSDGHQMGQDDGAFGRVHSQLVRRQNGAVGDGPEPEAGVLHRPAVQAPHGAHFVFPHAQSQALPEEHAVSLRGHVP